MKPLSIGALLAMDAVREFAEKFRRETGYRFTTLRHFRSGGDLKFEETIVVLPSFTYRGGTINAPRRSGGV
jgi:hypothetical protein